jgi:hypothetical protein
VDDVMAEAHRAYGGLVSVVEKVADRLIEEFPHIALHRHFLIWRLLQHFQADDPSRHLQDTITMLHKTKGIEWVPVTERLPEPANDPPTASDPPHIVLIRYEGQMRGPYAEGHYSHWHEMWFDQWYEEREVTHWAVKDELS